MRCRPVDDVRWRCRIPAECWRKASHAVMHIVVFGQCSNPVEAFRPAAYREGLAMCALAGRIGQARGTRSSLANAGGDDGGATIDDEIAEIVRLEPSTNGTLLRRRLERRTSALLRAHWNDVRLVATALNMLGQSDDVRDLT